MPAASDQLLRDLPGAQGWVFVPRAVLFAKITACVIDTSISKIVGCHTPAYNAMPWGDTQVQSNNNECVQTCCCLNTQMRLRLCRPSVLATEFNGSNGSFSAYRPRIEGGR